MKQPLLLAVLTLALLTPLPSSACSCACNGVAPLSVQVSSASAVVVAEVVELIPQTKIDRDGNEWIESCAEQIVHLRVKEVLKGEAHTEMFSRQSNIGTGCDLPFDLKIGTTYVLFLVGDCHAINGCAKSAPLPHGAALVEEIRKLTTTE